MSLLVTGWLGFIWSHTVVQLLETRYDIVIIDNMSNANPKAYEAIKKITNKKPILYSVDINDTGSLQKIFKNHNIQEVLHFAAHKSVSESCTKPGKYFHNNITGTINLVNTMLQYNCKKMVFSSSCTVYGIAKAPVTEQTPLGKTSNPYGSSKQLMEKILEDYATFSDMQIISLRYFNPIGSHPSGILWEDSTAVPTNLFPYAMKVAFGYLPKLQIYGNDYDTSDGTGMRDYIDIMDLADAHISALKYIQWIDSNKYEVCNIWTGKGTTVLEIVKAIEQATNKPLAYSFQPRRRGDIGAIYADTTKAKKLLGRQAIRTIHDSIQSTIEYYKSIWI